MGEAHGREERRRQVGIVSRVSRARFLSLHGGRCCFTKFGIRLVPLLTPTCFRTWYREEAADVGVSFKNADGEPFRPSPFLTVR